MASDPFPPSPQRPPGAAEPLRTAAAPGSNELKPGTRHSHEVFVSYSTRDKPWADAACAVLEGHRIRCWIAPRDILPGSEWGAAIVEGIDGCQLMVLIFSRNANDSPQVRREVERAISKGMTVLPFRIEDTRPAGAMEYALSNTHWLDAFTPPVERQMALLAESVQALLVKLQQKKQLDSMGAGTAEALAPAGKAPATPPVPRPAPPAEVLRVSCPSCGQKLKLSTAQRGKRVRCASCQQAFTVTSESDPPPLPPRGAGKKVAEPLAPDTLPRPQSLPPRPAAGPLSALALAGLAVAMLLGLLVGGCLLLNGSGRNGLAETHPKAAPLPYLPPEKKAAAAEKQEAAAPMGIVNSIGMKLVLIPAGKFLMGSPPGEDGHQGDEEQHEVEITQPFYLGVYVVTQEEYQKVMGNNPSWFSAQEGGKDKVAGQDTRRFPVENVSWNDAVEFCRKLTDRAEEKRSERTYRLPTEAEWEYACRGGARFSEPYHFGKTLSGAQANISTSNLERTTRVGSYPANNFGLFDMHGNVWEWCQDFYDKNYYARSPKQDPENKDAGNSRVLRGGSWGVEPRGARSAGRHDNEPGSRLNNVGFRVVLRFGVRTP